jgi:hypothetical protein
MGGSREDVAAALAGYARIDVIPHYGGEGRRSYVEVVHDPRDLRGPGT